MTSGRWTTDDLPDLTGRTAVVTGATSGIGLATVAALVDAGAGVVLAVRDVDRGHAVEAALAPAARVRRLDLADLDSVRDFAAQLISEARPIDILVNNAGVMAVPEGRTADGFELQLGTNHLGHFALTNLLLPLVTDRVVTVASAAHRLGTIRLDDLNWEHRRYRRWAAYCQSKLANLLFTLELDHRLVAAGSPVRAVAAHPGYTSTSLQGRTENLLEDTAMAVLNRIVGQRSELGALPVLYAATQDIPGASYVGPSGPFESRGFPALVGRTARAADEQLAWSLWQESERLTGTAFPDGSD
jgi:NAD(P)-dependent dehydrogenase (short-subunit alcohol dehydrogenase family)